MIVLETEEALGILQAENDLGIELQESQHANREELRLGLGIFCSGVGISFRF